MIKEKYHPSSSKLIFVPKIKPTQKKNTLKKTKERNIIQTISKEQTNLMMVTERGIGTRTLDKEEESSIPHRSICVIEKRTY